MDMKRIFLMLFYVCNGFIFRAKSYKISEKGTDMCQYYSKNRVAKCRRLHLYIPSLKESVLALEIRISYLPYISRQTFQNISSNKIIRLAFKMNNSIQAISTDAFSDLRYLQTLEVSFESQLDVFNFKSSLGSLNVSLLNELILESNGWTSLPGNLLDNLSGANLTVLSLNENDFEIMNASIFKPIFGLKKFFCVECSLAYFKVDGLMKVESIDLTGNNIFEVPNFCDNSGKHSLAPVLKKLILTDNAIRLILPSSFKCLLSLQSLILDGNRMKELKKNSFSILPSLIRLSITHIPRMEIIRQKTFNSSSLRSLQLSQNGFRFDHVHDLNYFRGLFINTYNLEKLDLSKNYLPHEPQHTLAMFSPLKQLRTLNIATTGIATIPEGLFQNMPYLQKLFLIGNKIARWNPSTFNNMTNLRKLHLDGNQIHIINRTSFPTMMLNKLETFEISNNPFWCTCDQRWFLDKLRSTNITKKMPNWPTYYSCAYPENLRHSSLSSYRPTDAECEISYFTSIIIIAVCSVLILVFFLALILYRCHINIKNLLYFVRVHHRIKKGYLKLMSCNDFDFDAFVVYCDSDRQWVHSNLIKRLEDNGLKICIHHRDFEVGEPIINNIEKFMNKSWKIIVVMSNDFAKSEWCQWEVNLALERRRRQGMNALVLIMYRQIDSKHMTSGLRTLLNTTPHLIFTEGLGERMFWNAIVNDINKSLMLPPAAIL
ncbi:toll-like receptor 13 [Mytilus californianus]|uniref:toll-like receptor 13 n=1 Tax=Mytilus californianus TaxID=6549 RepID=UPI0022471F49|nr:toll-like receptor 13 [Mytilus californianus]